MIVCDTLWRSSARTLGDERRKKRGKRERERERKRKGEKVAWKGKDRVPVSLAVD